MLPSRARLVEEARVLNDVGAPSMYDGRRLGFGASISDASDDGALDDRAWISSNASCAAAKMSE